MIHKGIIKAWDSGTWTASVQIIGSLGVWLGSIPVNRGIASGDMVVGRSVAVLFLDPGNPADVVVLAVWT
ncbi:MAG: hypothetical protein V3R87_00145 [Dehalococcoidia bacterium]